MTSCESCEVSYAQERIWNLTRPDPSTVNYNLPVALQLLGPLDPTALERAFNDAVRRHESLRTVFREVNGHVQQVILPQLEIPLATQSAPADDADAFLHARLADEAKRPFSLEDGPLLRLGLIALGPQWHVLLLTAHHIITDGWSANVLFGEVSALYDAYVRGREPVLTSQPSQYRIYANWQREWLRSAARDRELQYWREQLQGATPMLDLPAPASRPVDDRRLQTRYLFDLPEPLGSPLAGASRMHKATPFMLLLSAFKVLLHRYTEQEDICVGSWMAGRRRVEWENLIGLVRNAAIIRTPVRRHDSWASLVGRVGASASAAYDHQDTPFEEVLSTVAGPAATAWRRRLVWFNGGRRRQLELTGIDVTSVRTAPTSPGRYLSFSLNHVTTRGEVRWSGDVEYNPELIDPAVIEPMVADFQAVVHHLCAHPTQTVAEVEWVAGRRTQSLQ